jgi:intein/homing endonuclease
MLKYSHDYNIPYVITCDAHYRDKDHAKYHDLMLAIKDKKPLDDPDRFKYGVQDMYLKSSEEITRFFGRKIAEKGMENTISILNSCDEPSYIKPKGAILPAYPVNQEKDYKDFLKWKEKSTKDLAEDKAYLRYKCIEGFKSKLADFDKDKKDEYWERVKTELSVLENKNFSSYMLIVADYVNWAKQKMPVGPARGCFIPGSKVLMKDGSKKEIQDISIGEYVIAHDDTAREVEAVLCYSVDEELIEIEFENGTKITCTKEHEFYTVNRGFVKAEDLNEFDDIKEVY